MSNLILIGLGIAGSALVVRTALRASGPLARQMEQTVAQLGKYDFKYYRGGFEPKMTKREAGLVLGIGSTTRKQKIQEAHRKLMVLNHPDKGGSPFLAAKINQAKDVLENKMKK